MIGAWLQRLVLPQAAVPRTPADFRAREREVRAEEYQRYLESADWQHLRQRVLRRDGHACRFCGARASEVHHLTYARIFNETEYDLVAVCGACHEQLHPQGDPC